MEYIKTPLVRPLIRSKWAANKTNDINKLSTLRVLMFVYKRHETDILTVIVASTWALILVGKL